MLSKVYYFSPPYVPHDPKSHLDLINVTVFGVKYKSCSLSCCFLLPTLKFFLDPNNFLSILFSNILSLSFSRKLREYVNEIHQ